MGQDKMIVVIDYGMGNLKSVANALTLLGQDVCISSKREDIRNAERIILPGVGTFSEGMANLRKLGLIETLHEEVIGKKKQFLGICLGMHLLATTGYEGGVTPGLNFISGDVKRFEVEQKELKVPHMGWDDIMIKKDASLFKDVRKDNTFYFVHSYCFIPRQQEAVIATCDYGNEFTAALRKDNILATQFHPEKSQQNGLAFLTNFLTLGGA